MWKPEEWVSVLGAAAVVIAGLAKLLHELRGVGRNLDRLLDAVHEHDAASTRRLKAHEDASAARLTNAVDSIRGRGD